MSAPPVVLAVAGTDSGGAAGLAADLATIGHLGAHAACVVTAVTAQDTTGVHAVHTVPLPVVSAQVAAVLGDLPVAVVKTGMLGSPDVVDLVADDLGHLPLVVDPVLVATSGAVLGDAAVVAAYRRLLPSASVVTPNLDEARRLVGDDRARPEEAAARLAAHGCAVVVTGGREWRPGDGVVTCTDWVCAPGGRPTPVQHRAVATDADHGTGCTFSSALAAVLATASLPTRGPNPGQPPAPTPGAPDLEALLSACRQASAYTTGQLRRSASWRLGRGRGPVAHTSPTTPPTQEEHA